MTGLICYLIVVTAFCIMIEMFKMPDERDEE